MQAPFVLREAVQAASRLSSPDDEVKDRDRWMGGRPVLRRGNTVLTGTALTIDPQLWPLEHDYYAQPYFNEFEWKQHDAHECEQSYHPDCGEAQCVDCHDIAHVRPKCPPLWHWLEVYFDLSDELIAGHISGRWLSLADWKADMDVALEQFPLQVQRAVFHLWSGYGLSDVARMDFGGNQVAAVNALRSASSALRHATELNTKSGITSRIGESNALQRSRETAASGARSSRPLSGTYPGRIAFRPDHDAPVAAAGATAGPPG